MAQKKEGKILGMERDTFRSLMGKYGVSIVMLVLIVVIGIMQPLFLKPSNLINVATQITINGMLAFGMCMAITTGGIDLTVGAQIALGGVMFGICTVKGGMPVVVGVLATVAVTTLFGFINGFLIAKFNMFPFVVTLSMQLVIRGVSLVISGGQGIQMGNDVGNIYYTNVFGMIPLPIIIYLVVFVLMYLMFHWTKLGRYILAVGGNPNAALASGVSVFRIKIYAYAISGFLAGIASIILVAKTGNAKANIGEGYETDAVAACVIGGTSFAGGIATMPGVVIGTFIVGFIYNGINMVGIDGNYQSIIRGLVIILTVMMDMAINGKNRK